MLPFLVHKIFTFYINGVLNCKCPAPGPKVKWTVRVVMVWHWRVCWRNTFRRVNVLASFRKRNTLRSLWTLLWHIQNGSSHLLHSWISVLSPGSRNLLCTASASNVRIVWVSVSYRGDGLGHGGLLFGSTPIILGKLLTEGVEQPTEAVGGSRKFCYFTAVYFKVKKKPWRRTVACSRWIMQSDVTAMLTFNPLTPNDHYSGRTAPLTSKRCSLYIYSTNIGTEYFKHGIYSPFLVSL